MSNKKMSGTKMISVMHRMPYARESVQIRGFQMGMETLEEAQARIVAQYAKKHRTPPGEEFKTPPQATDEEPATLGERIEGLARVRKEEDDKIRRQVTAGLLTHSEHIVALEKAAAVSAKNTVTFAESHNVLAEKMRKLEVANEENARSRSEIMRQLQDCQNALRAHGIGAASGSKIARLETRVDASENAIRTLASNTNARVDETNKAVKKLNDAYTVVPQFGTLGAIQANYDAIRRSVHGVEGRLSETERRLNVAQEQAVRHGASIAKLEKTAETVAPTYTRENGTVVNISDMNEHHLKNAILLVMRDERLLPPVVFKNLCAEAERRGLDWKSWSEKTEPMTKYATRR